jgi:sugar lactone lactonase YvrE
VTLAGPAILAGGFGYLEAARWRDGWLYFSDIRNREVRRMRPDGRSEVAARIPSRPSGLGWTPGGDLLVIGMEDDTINHLGPGGEIRSRLALGDHLIHANDMAVDAVGRAYVSQFGYGLFDHSPPAPSSLLLVDAAGACSSQGENLWFPNGLALSPDGRTLVVAESFAFRLTAFDVGPGGALSGQRLFAQFAEAEVVDGICMDREGAVWVGVPSRGEFRRVLDGGAVTDIVRPAPGAGTYCVDCALGGPSLTTLFLLVSDTDVERLGNGWDSTGTVQALEVETPGF